MIGKIRRSSLSQYAIALIALPLAAMPLSATPEMMTLSVCTADGEVRSISIPLDEEDGDNHCVKPCHACLSRKKNLKN